MNQHADSTAAWPLIFGIEDLYAIVPAPRPPWPLAPTNAGPEAGYQPHEIPGRFVILCPDHGLPEGMGLERLDGGAELVLPIRFAPEPWHHCLRTFDGLGAWLLNISPLHPHVDHEPAPDTPRRRRYQCEARGPDIELVAGMCRCEDRPEQWANEYRNRPPVDEREAMDRQVFELVQDHHAEPEFKGLDVLAPLPGEHLLLRAPEASS